MKSLSHFFRVAALAALVATSGLAAAADTAQTSQLPAFPDPNSAWQKQGTFVNLDNLRNISAGMDKDQLYDLLGRPHFSEGMFGVKEWDYIFNFRKGNDVLVCQFKVQFDQDYKAKAFYWKPDTCAQEMFRGSPQQQPVRMSLSADAMFAFGKGEFQDLLPRGQRELRDLATQIRQLNGQVEKIEVIGHTDHLGSHSYNQTLSETRAMTVRDYLVQQGIPADRIITKGAGKSNPVVNCGGVSPREAQIECLAPNRRVELVVLMSEQR
ncbi:hypothetical protein A7J71_20630 [Achromobacter insolitus]|uniref:OmpA family protein n=1 Tax=Achromobacter insolitus TaxID=217204 RepID=UPI0007C67660|nr:OmpA family protein [Achromobacter insolitus]OAE71658.1 hypothetical protein A7J71_20630 [Achromobacter insolitus]OCZ52935.1 hypothetical protein A7P22_16220 [Achromobacter insolitus]